MALTYGIEEDIRYQQGFEASAIEIVKNMLLNSDFTTEQIMRYVKVSKEFVENIAKELKK